MFMHSEKYSKWIDFVSQPVELRKEYFEVVGLQIACRKNHLFNSIEFDY